MCVVQIREMVNVFNDKVTEEGKTELVEAGDPDGTLFLVNPDVRLTSKSYALIFYYS